MVAQLILTVTRACNLRCAYCPTVKQGWPELSVAQTERALDLFEARFGGGHLKLFGGEPLLRPDVVRAVLQSVARRPAIERVYLSTNGLGLTPAWLELLAAHPKAVLTISMDGVPDDHRALRRALPGVPDAYDHVVSLLPRLLEVPRVVVTQTIAPPKAEHAARNFAHLLSLGFTRFNLLPGYFLRWKPAQLQQLRQGFQAIGDLIEARWARGEGLYLRNLFTWQPTPFFNTGMIVDCDGSIHPSNVGLSGSLEDLWAQTRVGSLQEPPSVAELQVAQKAMPAMIEQRVAPAIWRSTLAADAELTALCRRLYPHYVAHRARRRRIA